MTADDREVAMGKLKAFAIAAALEAKVGDFNIIGWDHVAEGVPELDPGTAKRVVAEFDLTHHMFYRSFTYTVGECGCGTACL